MSCTDTINDASPLRDHVRRRLRYIEIGLTLEESSVSRFQEYIPTNPVLASSLWLSKDEMVSKGLDITPDTIIDYSISKDRLTVIDD